MIKFMYALKGNTTIQLFYYFLFFILDFIY